MTFCTELLCAFIALVFLFVGYRKWSLTYFSRKNVPFLQPSLIWGNLENPFRAKHGLKIDLKICYDEFRKRGNKFGGMYMMTDPIYIPADLDLIRDILSKNFAHFQDHGIPYDPQNDPLSANIFNLEGDEWRHMRSKLTPAFTSGKLKTMFNTLLDCSDPMMEHIDELCDNHEAMNAREVLACYTTDIIGSCAFGLECNSFKDPNAEFRKYGRKIFEPSLANNLKIFLAFAIPGIRKLIPFKTVESDVENFYMTVVKNLIEYRKANNVTRKDFVQLFIEMNEKAAAAGQEGFTMDQISAQSFVFFLGGFETSSSTMTLALHELAFNQDIQDKVRQEVKESIKSHGGKLTYDGVMEMKYLDLVVTETLRKYPIVPFLMRVCTKDYKVPHSDLMLKKGMKVFISSLGIHRDAEFYPDPEKFIPERFTEENKAKRHQFAYIPFGEGPRLCIGQRFGLMQVKTGISVLLNKYRILPVKGDSYKINFEPKAFNLSKEGEVFLNTEKLE